MPWEENASIFLTICQYMFYRFCICTLHALVKTYVYANKSYCIVLYCIVSYCVVSYCIVLYFPCTINRKCTIRIYLMLYLERLYIQLYMLMFASLPIPFHMAELQPNSSGTTIQCTLPVTSFTWSYPPSWQEIVVKYSICLDKTFASGIQLKVHYAYFFSKTRKRPKAGKWLVIMLLDNHTG